MRSHLTRAWVEVDLGAIRRNAAMLATRGPRLLPMVKADAYGLGAVPVARALAALDPWGFGVATVEEGVELRDAGITQRLVVFTPLVPDDLAAAREASLTPTLGHADEIAAWRALGGGPWHLAIDTGMNRAGVRWDAVDALFDALAAAPPEGACTHFHSAERDDGTMEVQTARFLRALDALPVRPALLHAENSAALARAAHSPFTLARPGIFLYGVGSGAPLAPEPVVRVCARVVDLRTVPAGESVSYDATWHAPDERRIATLAIGYADGYRRALGNRGEALLHGARVPVTGLVTMDMTMLDVTGVPCAPRDVATLVGRDGDDALDVDAVARDGALSPYELLTGLRGRLPRLYVEEA